MMRLLARIRRDQSGVTVVETALILPIVLVMCFGFSELANAFALHMKLSQAAQSGIEYVVASDTPVPADADIISRTSAISGVASSDIAITRKTECNGVAQATGVTSCPNSTDVEVDYLTVTVSGTYQPLTNVSLIKAFAPSGRYSQSATVRLP